MKKINLLLCAAVGMMLIPTACDQKPTEVPVDGSLTLSATELSFESTEQSAKTVAITTDASWIVSVEGSTWQDWLNVTPKSGKGNGEITVSCFAANRELEDRTAVITVYETSGTLDPQTITVTQLRKSQILTSVEGIFFEVEGGNETFTISANVEYEVSIPSEATWLSCADNNGTVTVTATENETGAYRSSEVTVTGSDLSATVTVTQGNGLVNYHKSIALRFTATWCGYCPTMATSLHMACDMVPDRIIPISVHANSSDLAYSSSNAFDRIYKIAGYPTGIVDARGEVQNYEPEVGSQIFAGLANEAVASYVPKSNISFTSSVDGNNVKVNASIIVNEEDTYTVTVMVVEDNIVYPQNGATTDYVHNGVVRAFLSDVKGDAMDAMVGVPYEKEFSATVPSSLDVNYENAYIVVWVQRTKPSNGVSAVPLALYNDYGFIVDNGAIAPVGETLEHRYEE